MIVPVLLIVLFVVYRWGGDAVAGLTVFPYWSWGVFALLGCIRFQWKLLRRDLGLGLLVFVLLTSMSGEEVWTMMRPREARPNVAVLNCAGGLSEAAQEAFRTGANLILLSETPSQKDLERLVEQEWGEGDVLAGPDGAIVVRGKIVPGSELKSVNATMATVEFEGYRWNVVALRLSPPVFRVDFVTPAYWEDYQRNLRSRRDELSEVMATIRDHFGEAGADVIAGDFNAPRPQGIDRDMDGYLDAICESGGGWTGSAVNDFPLVRIDHVYFGSGLKATGGRVDKTKNSDHRLVLVHLQDK